MEFYLHYLTQNTSVVVSAVVTTFMMIGVSVWLLFKTGNWISLVVSWLLFLTLLGLSFMRLSHSDYVQTQLWEDYLCDMTEAFAKSTQEFGHSQIRSDQDYHVSYDHIINIHSTWCRDLADVGYVYTFRLIGPNRVEYICSCPADINRDGKIEGPLEEGDSPFTPYIEEGEYAWYDIYAKGFEGKTAIDPEVDSTDYGRWVTAVSPLLDSDGQVEAILGVDFRVEKWDAYMKSIRGKSLALMNAVCMLFFLGVILSVHLHHSLVTSRELNKDLQATSRQAYAASDAKSEFLAKMSHEIRTPISGVIGLSDLLIGTKLDPKQHEYAQLIKASGQSLLFLINDILDFSKIEAGKLELDAESFDLLAVVESVLGILSFRTAEKNIELCTTFDTGLPRRVIGDAGRIRQILLNLVANAVKFTETGGVSIHVAAIEYRTDQILTSFVVKDTGIGIPNDRINTLFDVFSQVNSSSARTYGGTGLGLAISRQLVKLMRGEIGVESTLGQGSTFWFQIPLSCDPRVVNCLKNSLHTCVKSQADACEVNGRYFCFGSGYHQMSQGFQLKGIRVLVTDPHEIVRQTVCKQLSVWEMLPEAATPNETLEKLVHAAREKRPYSLLIVGQGDHAKGSDNFGEALIQQVRETLEIKDTAIILMQPLSSQVNPEFFSKYSVESLSKPIFMSAFFDAVMNQLFQNYEAKSVKQIPESSDAEPFKVFAEPIHILVAEDNRINQIVIQNILQQAGLTYEIANNGHEALHAAMTRPFDMILMDCQMPEMDGYESTDLIRKWERERNRPRIPIIALTANAVVGDEKKCLDAGMDAYCSKPVNPKLVIQTIEQWYQKKKKGTVGG